MFGGVKLTQNFYCRNRIFIFYFLFKNKGIGKLGGEEMAHTYSWQDPDGLQYTDLQLNCAQAFRIWPSRQM